MKILGNILDQLYQSRKESPQVQRDLVLDVVCQTWFLKQVVSATAFGVALGTCNHFAYATGINGLPDLGDNDRSNLSPYQADLLGKQVILNIYAQGSMVDDYDCLDYLNTLGDQLVVFHQWLVINLILSN